MNTIEPDQSFRLKVVEEYLSQPESFDAIAEKYRVAQFTLQMWVEGLKHHFLEETDASRLQASDTDGVTEPISEATVKHLIEAGVRVEAFVDMQIVSTDMDVEFYLYLRYNQNITRMLYTRNGGQRAFKTMKAVVKWLNAFRIPRLRMEVYFNH
ncbi:MAG: hypothetical protein AAGB12_13035 [Pseudomonadota bacterium]